MKKFAVEICDRIISTIEVEANSENEAYNKVVNNLDELFEERVGETAGGISATGHVDEIKE